MTTAGTSIEARSGRRGHACALFRGEAEERAAFIRLSADCVGCGEQCIQFVDGKLQSERVRALGAAGVDVPGLMATGQLDVRTWDATYLRQGRFDPEAQLALIDALVGPLRQPRSRAQLWADMDWCLSGAPGCDRLIEYESRLNAVIDSESALVVCAYDVRLHDARTVLDLLHTHPLVLVEGVLRANPLYVPPGEFLGELHARSGDER
jgi:chemotaxis family two-component system sensor kinase Cph1